VASTWSTSDHISLILLQGALDRQIIGRVAANKFQIVDGNVFKRAFISSKVSKDPAVETLRFYTAGKEQYLVPG
jgi:hypothetical protein